MHDMDDHGRSWFAVPLLAAVLLSTSCGGGRAAVTHPGSEQARSADATPSPARDRPRLVFLGDSLTAGYNLEASQAYPALIQQKIDGAGLEFEVVNAGISGDTSSGGLHRLDWVLSEGAAVLVLALGANDGLRGIDLTSTRRNLEAILDRCDREGIRVVLAGMQIPPNYGPEYSRKFRELFTELQVSRKLPTVPFLLDAVGGVDELNLADGIHPNAEGQKILAANVWTVLEPVLRELAAWRSSRG